VECISSAERARDVATALLSIASGHTKRQDDGLVVDLASPAIGVDCEGVRLGRFGRICLVQIAAPDGRLLLLDALRPGLMEALAPVLESESIVKVLHDCREDSSALYHQHGIELRCVFDTQAAQVAVDSLAKKAPHQPSAQMLMSRYLDVQDPPEVADVKTLMLEDRKVWAKRPLSGVLVRYALHGVAHMLELREAMLQQLAGGDQSILLEMQRASQRAAEYRLLNQDFPTAASMAKIGTRLWAYFASRTDSGIYMKLNAGRVGLVSTSAAIARFKDVQLGDAVLCCVSGVSIDGSYLYLDRYDHDWDFFDHQLRPSKEREVGVYGREHLHSPSLVEGETVIDPLLLRGLPATANADLLGKGAAFDEWDADHIDLGLPAELEL